MLEIDVVVAIVVPWWEHVEVIGRDVATIVLRASRRRDNWPGIVCCRTLALALRLPHYERVQVDT